MKNDKECVYRSTKVTITMLFFKKKRNNNVILKRDESNFLKIKKLLFFNEVLLSLDSLNIIFGAVVCVILSLLLLIR